MPTTNAAIGARVAALRKARHLTQADLAEALGLEHKQVVSNLEKGQRALKAAEVARLAELFRVSPLALLGLQSDPAKTTVLWRHPAEERARQADEAAFLDRCRRYAFVERLSGINPATLALGFNCEPERTSYEAAATWGEQARDALGFGSMPAPGLQAALENQHGIKIFVTRLAGGSGATSRSEFGDAILVNAAEPPGRRAYSVAHELFHLFTWESTCALSAAATQAPSDRLEQLAENFAAAFVLPRETLLPRLPDGEPGEWRVVQWVELAREFGVTVPALAWRLVNLGKLSRERAQKIITDPSRSGAGCRPEDSAPGELPERYVMLAFKAYVEGEISIGKLAELLETTVGMLRKALRAYGLDLDSDVWQAEALPA
jgi:Zn-dependent peptidase ImmA (M78 family)/transcriptional regulator with XRE-family HTH domain